MKSLKKLKRMKTNNWKLFYNPFVKIAGFQSLILGLIIVLASAIIGKFGNLVFDGAIDAHIIKDVSLTKSLIYAAIDIFSLFFVMSLAARFITKNFRLIDILGTMTLAKAPFILLAIFSLFVSAPDISEIMQNPMSVLSNIPFLLFGLLSLPIFVWFIALLFNAYKVSTGESGSKLIVSFIVGLVVAEILSKILIIIIF